MEGYSLPESYSLASEKTIRKTRSFQSLRDEWLSSDDTLGSENYADSIYNAERVLSQESLSEHPRSCTTAASESDPSPQKLLSPSLSPRTPHSQWPAPQLSTIIEQNSIQTLRPSQSAPRLRPSPKKCPTVVHSKESIHSLYASLRPKGSRGIAVRTTLYQNRSFSVNDLDHMLRDTVTVSADPQSSSTSDGAIDRTQLPQYPVQPPRTPPYRAPTPPGLPSFGSQEAQAFRLTPPPPRSFWSRIWRQQSNEVNSDQTQATTPVASPAAASLPLSPQIAPTPSSMELFKRTLAMIGMSRVVTAPSNIPANPRAFLPPGIYISATPGSLTQAEDGTFMRGRFYSRASGHGVGSRTLESHPLIRRAQSDRLSEIEEQVRAIDKAHQRAEREALELQSISCHSPGPARMTTESPRQSDTGATSIPTVMTEPVPAQSSVERGAALPSIIEADRERGMLRTGIEEPKERRVDWGRICYAMSCCQSFWFWCCCGCDHDPDPDPGDRDHVIGGRTLSGQTHLYQH
ncbi:uncharacterized protein A1O9_08603 [Exophiala aquamarina CBS 119918]|uniref:Uncharacterized protein n=1 Tax=Exophiala aquamarina CBS 119918 TaxID=1182545 RepID=A0A072P511_9EURO|nr:uncharacterized protein A1O9_08603 [Exophiala aquamarina CBS 119918]KEF54951.1 hypothetical protein A1O9_08603 [Exophiala aquamarina CBS 119918]